MQKGGDPLPLVPGPLPIYHDPLATPPSTMAAGRTVGATAAPPPPRPTSRATSREERYASPRSEGSSDQTRTYIFLIGAGVLVILMVIGAAAANRSEINALRNRMRYMEDENARKAQQIAEEESRRACAWCKGSGRYEDRLCQACEGSGRAFRTEGGGGEGPLVPVQPGGGGREPKGLEGSDEMVFVNSAGKVYHSGTCPDLGDGRVGIERRQAEAMRYEPCRKCR